MPGPKSTYTPELGEKILALMEKGHSITASAASLGVGRRTLYDWEQKIPEFADIIELARGKRLLFLETRLFTAKAGHEVTSSIFALKNADPLEWSDRTSQEVTHKGGVTVTISSDDAKL